MKKQLCITMLALLLLSLVMAGCASSSQETTEETAKSATEEPTEEPLDPGIYINGWIVDLTEDEAIDLTLLSVENGGNRNGREGE